MVSMSGGDPTERTVDETLTAKMRCRAGPRHRPPSIDSVLARLNRFLGRRLSGTFSITSFRGLAGGSSKEQYAFDLHWSKTHMAPNRSRTLSPRPGPRLAWRRPFYRCRFRVR